MHASQKQWLLDGKYWKFGVYKPSFPWFWFVLCFVFVHLVLRLPLVCRYVESCQTVTRAHSCSARSILTGGSLVRSSTVEGTRIILEPRNGSFWNTDHLEHRGKENSPGLQSDTSFADHFGTSFGSASKASFASENERFVLPPKVSRASLQNERFVRDFLQK